MRISNEKKNSGHIFTQFRKFFFLAKYEKLFLKERYELSRATTTTTKKDDTTFYFIVSLGVSSLNPNLCIK